MNKDLKIEIRPIPNRENIKIFSEELEYFSPAHILSPFVSATTRKYVTGLTEEDKKYLKEEGFPYDITDTYDKRKPSEFWEGNLMKVELKNSPTFLFPGKNLIDFCKYKYLQKNDYIYSSEKEISSGDKSQATHFIYNESVENEIKATKIEKRNTLIKKISELSLKRKRDFILIIKDELTENKDENYLTLKFDEILNNKKDTSKIEALLLVKNEDVSLRAVIKKAIKNNVLSVTRKGIYFYEANLGFAEQDVAEFLGKKENQEILINIKSKIK